MIRRILGAIFVVIGGLMLLGFVIQLARGELFVPRGQPMYGHQEAYEQGARAGLFCSLMLAVMLFVGGLLLLFSRGDYRGPPSERDMELRKGKRRRIATPKPPEDY